MEKEITRIRIQKYLSNKGVASRREVERLIEAKRIKINGQIAKLGDTVCESDQILLDSRKIETKTPEKIYILLNKPRAVICTRNDPKGRRTIFDLVAENKYLFSVGRLDYNTTGVILLTNDGELTNYLSHPSNQIKREYIATVEKELSNEDLKLLNSNNFILDGKISKQVVKKISPLVYQVELCEGRNHHVKNMFLAINNSVKNLHRKRFWIFSDADLKIGEQKKINSSVIAKLLA
ncbi:pseudouridine synthase [Metamycoplasma hyosynoviae]|uniref:Pseudouridine synthase n=1 Tax=Metamycoplasma hyosynoviae TaxID=29559 RepID=A0AAP4ENH7_9BACT|nr:pseudouridine synthase [Metamycoplasma hyosynoviae]MDC8963049.1 pseudouridine synthase [Metamycoplasma hyosynoviae]MDD1359319.1 pseudouridine synthase [Metamycoplasma hyosynoviae]MDD7883836.1 pseudouridine synthase [Metamycoplasma hyosynoviae]MDD7893508.1 pseudouridine synthase [Metamycoplasma hyosynoviae]MDD7907260.1 pseudouridine synthase [Metamycoplasma hyosynoviae]